MLAEPISSPKVAAPSAGPSWKYLLKIVVVIWSANSPATPRTSADATIATVFVMFLLFRFIVCLCLSYPGRLLSFSHQGSPAVESCQSFLPAPREESACAPIHIAD